MTKFKENIEDWKPFRLVFGKNAFSKKIPFERNIEYYKRSWFCYDLSIIHYSEKSVLNCVYCSKKYFKLKKNEK